MFYSSEFENHGSLVVCGGDQENVFERLDLKAKCRIDDSRTKRINPMNVCRWAEEPRNIRSAGIHHMVFIK
jgi:hypothetical protein